MKKCAVLACTFSSPWNLVKMPGYPGKDDGRILRAKVFRCGEALRNVSAEHVRLTVRHFQSVHLMKYTAYIAYLLHIFCISFAYLLHVVGPRMPSDGRNVEEREHFEKRRTL